MKKNFEEFAEACWFALLGIGCLSVAGIVLFGALYIIVQMTK